MEKNTIHPTQRESIPTIISQKPHAKLSSNSHGPCFFPNQIQLLAKVLIKSPSSDKPPFDIPTLRTNTPTAELKTSEVECPNINLSGGVLLVVVFNGLDSRITDEELVEESTGEADGEALGGTHHEAPERGTGGDTGHGLAGQGSGPVEDGVAVHDSGHTSFFNCAQAVRKGRRENRTYCRVQLEQPTQKTGTDVPFRTPSDTAKFLDRLVGDGDRSFIETSSQVPRK